MDSVSLREQRAALVAQARQLVEAANSENRDLNTEEKSSFDKFMAEVDALKSRIDAIEKVSSLQSEIEETPRHNRVRLETRGADHRHQDSDEYHQAYRHWLVTGEYRDTILGTDAKGGFLVTPTRVSEAVAKAVDDQVFIRKLAHVEKVLEAKALGVRKLATRMADADWTGEVTAVTEDTTMAFGRRDLTPSLLSKMAQISIHMLNNSVDVEKRVLDELAYKFAITEEKAFMTGNGSGKPMGVFYADANGISTGRDVVCGTTTAITADKLLDVRYTIKGAYLQSKSAGWIFHRDAVKQIRKLADSTGQYLWQPSLQAGSPDMLLGVPLYTSEYAPNTFTTGLYVGILGDFSNYWIAEVKDLQIQRLVERYADTNEVGYIGRKWLDGAPIVEEGFVRCKLA